MIKHNNPPPIQWLPVFVAAARHGSFKKAADQLHVSPSAISQQIKALEAFLDIPLFRRQGPRVTLTDAGELYFRSAEKTIAHHQSGFDALLRQFRQQSLRLNAPLFIAQELLIPDYLGFKALQPDTELRITTGTEYIDFDEDEADAAVRFGTGHWPGLIAQPLCPVQISPVCSGALQQDHWQNLNLAEIAAQHTLISTRSDLADWRQLVPDIEPTQLIVCDSYFSAMKSVEKGLGIGLGILPAINNWLNQGLLCQIKPDCYPVDSAYWLVYPERQQHNELITGCYEWLRSVFATLPDLQT